MQKIAAGLEAQKNRDTPEGRMADAAFMRSMLPVKRGNQSSTKDLRTRFLSHVAFGASDCWYWVGSTDALGYGRFTHPQENKAHRAALRLFKGDIPDGLRVMHQCDTRCCVNPDHLHIGTQADNVADMVRKGRHRTKPLCGEKNPMARLTLAQVEEIRTRVAAGETQRAMCSIFGASPMTISRIVRMETWK